MVKNKIELAQMIDHTNLKPFITNEKWKELCEQANEYQFKTIAINNAGILFCYEILSQMPNSVLIDAAIGFPLGASTLETKLFETKDAIEKGAKEVDYVLNISALKNRDLAYIKKEMQGITTICRNHSVTSKVILETCYLKDDEKKQVCEIATQVGIDFVKTSTGFGTAGASVQDITLMKSIVGESCKIKASGGIANLEQAYMMIQAGASRLGTSKGIEIIKEFEKEN